MSGDVVVIGAGQAGLAMSHELAACGIQHQVLEARERLGGAWLDRWDSFCLVTPNFACLLPGHPYDRPDADAFMPRDEIVGYLERYARSFDAPVRFGEHVRRLTRENGGLRLDLAAGEVVARHVVVATGAWQRPRIPAPSADLPKRIAQLHTHDYRSEAALPPGAVLIVGAGQSGAQIAEELLEAGRTVYLATSRVGRAPRRYRGRDIVHWLLTWGARGAELGVPPRTVAELPSPAARFAPMPQLSGKRGGHDLDLRELARNGLRLAGRLGSVEGERVVFADDLADNLRFADAWFDAQVRTPLDEIIARAEPDAPPDDRVPSTNEPVAVRGLDLARDGVSTVIWATGYRPDFSWIDLPIFDEYGYPRQARGVTEVPGLFFLGLPWMHTQGSSLLMGVGRDATHLAEVVSGRQ